VVRLARARPADRRGHGVNLLVAGLSGTLIPLGLERLGVDPAIASSVFLTTVTDVVGFFAFLGLAAWFLL
jgi:magnesium transporter